MMAFSKLHRWQDAVSMLHNIRNGKAGHGEPNHKCVKATISASPWETALNILHSMEQHSDKAQKDQLGHAALKVSARAGQWVHALDLFQKMHSGQNTLHSEPIDWILKG